MNLEQFSDLLVGHLALDEGSAIPTFSRRSVPPALTLPPGGIPLNDFATFIADLLEKVLGLQGLGTTFSDLDGLHQVMLTRFDLDLAEETANSTLFLGLELHGVDEQHPFEWTLVDQDDLLGGKLAIKNPGVTIGRLGQNTELDFYGVLDLPRGAYAVSASWPSKQLSATYVGKGMNVGDLLASLGGPLDGFQWKIDSVFLSADLPNSSYAFSMGLEEFSIPLLPLHFGETHLEVQHEQGDVSASVDTRTTIAGKDLDITVNLRHGKIDLSGSTGENIEIGVLIDDLATIFEVNSNVPAAIADLTINHLSTTYNSEMGTFSLHCGSKFPMDEHGKEVPITVTIELETGEDGQYEKKFGGHITIPTAKDDLQFDLQFEEDVAPDDGEATAFFTASFWQEAPLKLQLKEDLMAAVISDKDLLAAVPPLELDLQSVTFAYLNEGGQPKSKTIFGLALAADMNLAALPLVGSLVNSAPGDPAGIKDLQVLYASQAVSRAQVETLNSLLPEQAQLPLPQDSAKNGAEDESSQPPALNKGLNLAGKLNTGMETIDLSTAGQEPAVGGGTEVPSTGNGATTGSAETAVATTPTPDGNAKWFDVQKALGPLYFEKIGLRYEKGEIWFLLNADLTLAGLTIMLDGLALSTPLDHFDPSFHLSGLGIEYKNGPLEIGGMFVHFQETDEAGNTFDEYSGLVVVKSETLSLSAIGSYADLGGEPSMFIYLAIDYPLGGPPFFFVTGLAGGFGYNRSLTVPPVERLRQFPFVAQALAPVGSSNGASGGGDPTKSVTNPKELKSSLDGQLRQLQQYVQPQIGEYWMAIGVHFTSFEIVDGFALLTISFGHRFELNVLGSATYAYPPGSEEVGHPLTRIDVVFKATYLPDEGLLDFSALLAESSFLYDKACVLTGGMAFRTWFSGPNKDEFILTIGGYHPKFKVPAHYPTVPRLGFNWHYSDALTVKGGAYLAMTGHVLMAGAFLDALWDEGDLQAWFKASADFLIRYKPFSYDVAVSVEIGASVTIHFFGTHHLTVQLGADLHIWGPPFAGSATFDIWVASFTIHFGDDGGGAKPIPWVEFATSFLPAAQSLAPGSTLPRGGKFGGAAEQVRLPHEDLPEGGAVVEKEKDHYFVSHDVCSVTVQDGLNRSVAHKALTVEQQKELQSRYGQTERSGLHLPAQEDAAVVVVNPKELSIRTGSIAPITTHNGPEPVTHTASPNATSRPAFNLHINDDIGIAPMALESDTVVSGHRVTIQRLTENGQWEDAAFDFDFIPLRKNVPAGLWGKWGKGSKPDVNGQRLIGDTLAGFEVRARLPRQPDRSAKIDSDSLAYETQLYPTSYSWEAFPDVNVNSAAAGKTDVTQVIEDVADALAVSRDRESLFELFAGGEALAGFTHGLTDTHAVVDSLLATPTIISLEGDL